MEKIAHAHSILYLYLMLMVSEYLLNCFCYCVSDLNELSHISVPVLNLNQSASLYYSNMNVLTTFNYFEIDLVQVMHNFSAISLYLISYL